MEGKLVDFSHSKGKKGQNCAQNSPKLRTGSGFFPLPFLLPYLCSRNQMAILLRKRK
jgi:hypothetical protein